jgi:tetratricopeptide (TPR) repeat protein
VPVNKQKDAAQEKYYDLLQKKLNLVSCIGNLCYAIGISCIQYYVLYTKIIITFFGADSFEASNCYFLIGCYYAEEGYFRKAIKCFEKAALIRNKNNTNLGGDCLYNIGILYKLQGELPKALETLEKALKMRESQYGEDSSKVAEINEIMGIIYTELNDFKTAMIEYEKAFQLRSTEPHSAEL